jgi:lipopolysaccharide/colanic/teichoic acid biosynthesis glycosyltransferase
MSNMSDIIDVAIIGAGPNRLSVAAHLRTAGASYCHFDTAMQLRRPAVRGGHMSLVGPRWERPHFTEQPVREIPVSRGGTGYPGMTGRAQVNALSEDTSILERSRVSGHYMEDRSIAQNPAILARTVGAVIRGTRPVMS